MQESSAIISMPFRQHGMLKKVLAVLTVLFVTGILIVLMYAGGVV